MIIKNLVCILLLIISSIPLFAQFHQNSNFEHLTIAEMDSIYYAKVAFKKKNYQNFQVYQAKEKRSKLITNTLIGATVGAVVGIGIDETARSGCNLLIFPVQVFTDDDLCPPQTAKAAFLGGLAGIGIGMTIGITKGRKIQFYPARIY